MKEGWDSVAFLLSDNLILFGRDPSAGRWFCSSQLLWQEVFKNATEQPPPPQKKNKKWHKKKGSHEILEILEVM